MYIDDIQKIENEELTEDECINKLKCSIDKNEDGCCMLRGFYLNGRDVRILTLSNGSTIIIIDPKK